MQAYDTTVVGLQGGRTWSWGYRHFSLKYTGEYATPWWKEISIPVWILGAFIFALYLFPLVLISSILLRMLLKIDLTHNRANSSELKLGLRI
eukprot:COSAG01_NODE_39370_length_477_cov_1.066138_1_plen_91_part_10